MPEQNVTINENARVSLSISSWWHVAVIIGTIFFCYFGLKAQVDKAIDQSSTAASQSQRNNDQIMQMQGDIRAINDNVGWFRKQYEQDMSRYIRDTPKR